MPSFSRISLARLNTCHADLQILFAEVVKDYDCTIVDGHRGEDKQNQYFDEGKSEVRYPDSKHNCIPSEAVDAAPYEAYGIDWGEKQLIHFSGYVLGKADQLYRNGIMKHKIRSGIDWNRDYDIDDTNFKDTPHFEIIK